MYVDFTDLNIVCPKYPYPHPNIDHMIDESSRYKTLRFMDAYFYYNQIKMDPVKAPKITIMSNHDNYYYSVMHFGINNTSVTYQRLTDAVSPKQIWCNLKVYISDMIVKTS